jgi:hypothetical protein
VAVGYGHKFILARGFELRLEYGLDRRKANPLRVGRGLQIRVIVQELDVEQSDDPDRIVWRGLGRRASANGDGSENQERRNPQRGKPRATGSEQTFAPAKAPTTTCIGRDPGACFGFATRHRLIPSKIDYRATCISSAV